MVDRGERVPEMDDELRHRADPNVAASEAVVSAVVRATEEASFGDATDVTDLPPLYDAVDTDALDELFESAWDDAETDVSVSFVYADYYVTVDATGLISVSSPL